MWASERQMIDLATKRLSEMLGLSEELVLVEHPADVPNELSFDVVIKSGHFSFGLDVMATANLGSVVRAIEQLKRLTAASPGILVPVLAVPFMSRSGRDHCERAGVGWLDLSGNAKIAAQGLYINSTGHPNAFRRRLESAFGVRGSRVTRHLLINSRKAIRQREIAKATGLDEGYVSRVVRRLRENGLVDTTAEGVSVDDRDLLLEAWSDEYRFDRHRVIRGHMTVPHGDEVIGVLSGALSSCGLRYAATGLSAAWIYTRFAGHRLSTIYVDDEPASDLLNDIGFRGESRGANTWLVVPNDDGVFDGLNEVEGIWCAHPVQVYLDLKGHPERSEEAAAELRKRWLLWNDHGG